MGGDGEVMMWERNRKGYRERRHGGKGTIGR
jgi:hypothetical protein